MQPCVNVWPCNFNQSQWNGKRRDREYRPTGNGRHAIFTFRNTKINSQRDANGRNVSAKWIDCDRYWSITLIIPPNGLTLGQQWHVGARATSTSGSSCIFPRSPCDALSADDHWLLARQQTSKIVKFLSFTSRVTLRHASPGKVTKGPLIGWNHPRSRSKRNKCPCHRQRSRKIVQR